MTLNDNQMGLLFVVLIGIALVGLAAWERHRGQQLQKNGVSTSARIQRVDWFGRKGGYHIEIAYATTDTAQPYTHTLTTRLVYKEGDNIPIRYLKDNPKICVQEDYFNGRSQSAPMQLFLLGLVVLLFGICGLILSISRS
jgi:hypothetical protein